MPKPKPRETEQEFVSRCIPIVMREGTTNDNQQAAAICHSLFKEKKMTIHTELTHDDLVEAIKSRQSENEFNYGILTADRYVKTVQECVGTDACYKFAATRNTSFDDIMKKAAKSLTYNNQDMVVKDIYSDFENVSGLDIELPKNTLMVFKHTLTTPRKDRDGDILRTQGARLDPKMLLLWQHIHTLPIGKMLGIALHNSKTLDVYSAIVDMNDLSHDSAVMVDSGMGRFSHGFKALEFVSMKEEQGKVTKPGGFDVKVFEVLEESLVSVPSNVDADTQEIIVGLVEGGKMTSPMMKNMSKHYRENMPKQFQSHGGVLDLPIDIKLTLNGKEISDAEFSGTGKDEARGTEEKACGCGGSSKEADDDWNNEDEHTDDKEVNDQDSFDKDVNADYEKSGRTLSSTNYKKLQDAHEDLGEVHEHCSTRSGKALCNGARQKIFDVLNTQKVGDEQRDVEYTVKDAMEMMVLHATPEERKQMIKSLQALEEIDTITKRTEEYLNLKGKSSKN